MDPATKTANQTAPESEVMAGGRERKRKSSGPLHRGGFGGGGVEKGASSSMAPRRKSTAAAVPDLTVPDTDFLDCDICFLPLKPPIFQCAVGHVVCSMCGDKLKDAGECHVCGVAISGGCRRCHAMERVVDSIRAPCPHTSYGCDACPPYHAREVREDHLRQCPGEACGFVGSTAALLDHVGGAHGWRCWGSATLPVWLRDGFQFVVSDEADEHGRKYVFLLNVVRHPFCRAISVLCIRPRAAAAKEIKCELGYLLPPDRDEGDPLVSVTLPAGRQVSPTQDVPRRSSRSSKPNPRVIGESWAV